MGMLNGLHETEHFENKSNAFGTEQNFLGTERNVSGMECVAFLGMERFVCFGLVFNFTHIRISSHCESPFCLSSLRQDENESLSYLIRSTCSCVILFNLKRTCKSLSVKIIDIISLFKQLCLHSEYNDRYLAMFTVLKIITLIDC